VSVRVNIKFNSPRWLIKFMRGASLNMDAAAIALQGHIIDKVSVGQPASKPGEPPHVLQGHLHRNIGWDRVKALVRKVGVGIGNTKKIGYALHLEFGTGPHRVVVGEHMRLSDRKIFKSGKRRGEVRKEAKVRKGMDYIHPGMAARPYLRPGLYEFRDELVRIITTPIEMA